MATEADITYEWRFTTQIQNHDTFLYNTGPITSLDDPDFNIRQSYTVAKVQGFRCATRTASTSPIPVVTASSSATCRTQSRRG